MTELEALTTVCKKKLEEHFKEKKMSKCFRIYLNGELITPKKGSYRTAGAAKRSLQAELLYSFYYQYSYDINLQNFVKNIKDTNLVGVNGFITKKRYQNRPNVINNL